MIFHMIEPTDSGLRYRATLYRAETKDEAEVIYKRETGRTAYAYSENEWRGGFVEARYPAALLIKHDVQLTPFSDPNWEERFHSV